jgi:dihydropteroate synthase
MTAQYFQCGRYHFPLLADDVRRQRPLIMGILNVTPDSFSDGGRFLSLDAALNRAEQMIADGVDIIDIGGESSRPGAAPLSLHDELQRVLPLVYALRDCGKPVSVDTYKPEVMRQVLAAGADMINDINGLRIPGALEVVAASDCGLCVMHMLGEPRTMQNEPAYQDVVAEVGAFLQQRVMQLQQFGVARARLCIDPGFGFGKTLAHNIELARNLPHLRQQLDLPLLVGISRKSLLRELTGRPVEQRLAGSLAAALAACANGAQILRVHDVAETADALCVWQALVHQEQEGLRLQ